MHFPREMESAKRWMVRKHDPGTSSKRPYSALVVRPDEYVPKDADERPGVWRYRWNQLCVCSDYATATSYLESNPETTEGLSFVLHPGDDTSERARIVCFDFDRAFDPNGNVWPEVQDIIDLFDSFVEYSRSGNGLHLFFATRCVPFTNILQAALNENCAVDILCSSQVAVTGKVFENNDTLRGVDFDLLQSFPFFKFRESTNDYCDVDFKDWWEAEEEELTDEHDHLAKEMREWPEAIKSHGRSKTTMAAACRIMRDGVIGWQALRLLEMVPMSPPLVEWELKHKLEDAYKKTKSDGTFGGDTPEFGIIEEPEAFDLPGVEPEKKPELKSYRIYSVAELDTMDLKLDFLVDGAFVDRLPMFIGGREKSFKTGVACDLLLSLASGTKFLDRFQVMEKRSCMFFTAEIGLAPAKDLVRRIRECKGIDSGVIDNMHVADFMPNFKDKIKVELLTKILDDYKPQVVAFDPLYFALGDAAVGDMYEIGNILQKISDLCREREIWPIIAHHARKDASKELSPMELSDLYGAGVSAFARQWLLISHATPYTEGQADLHVKMGGSATGDLGLWNLKISEGVVDELVDSRSWHVIMEKAEASSSVHDDEVLDLIGDEPVSKKDIAAICGIPGSTVNVIIGKLHRDGKVICQNGKFMRKEEVLF